jgi:hypothetical protein
LTIYKQPRSSLIQLTVITKTYSKADTPVPINNYDSNQFTGIRYVVTVVATVIFIFEQEYSTHPTGI